MNWHVTQYKYIDWKQEWEWSSKAIFDSLETNRKEAVKKKAKQVRESLACLRDDDATYSKIEKQEQINPTGYRRGKVGHKSFRIQHKNNRAS